MILDICLDEGDISNKDGIEILKFIKNNKLLFPVVIYSGVAKFDTTMQALNLGADAWIPKGLQIDDLINRIKKLINYDLIQENLRLQDEVSSDFLIGTTPSTVKLMDLILKAATDATASVLITGETGTGKSVIAKQIHRLGKRCLKPFISFSLANISVSSSAIHQELWGTEKGIFTDVGEVKGLFEKANGGILFLDEIAEISPEIQVKLLQVLDERRVRRSGGTKDIEFDIQLISATNKNIYENVKKGLFRDDLFYRINTLTITTVPIRDMKEDIPRFANYYLKKLFLSKRTQIEGFTKEALEYLMQQTWNGNIRELFHVIERSAILHPKPAKMLLDVIHLKLYDNIIKAELISKNSFNISYETLRLQLEIIEKSARLANGRKTKIVNYIEDISDKDWPRKTIEKVINEFPDLINSFSYLKELYNLKTER
jgi:DNA-binding NtrC family response regulator